MSLLDVLRKESEQSMAETAAKGSSETQDREGVNTAQSKDFDNKKSDTKIDKSKKEVFADLSFDEDAIPSVVDDIFNTALKKHASDVHFKPTENKLEVYLRVDGGMVEYKVFDKIYHHPIVARIKIISGLKIDEHRLPQDGKSSFKGRDNGKIEVDLRVSILPSQYGEKIVIRLLEKNPKMVELRDLGMLPNSLIKVDRYLQSSYGMILAVGPTGSGKSTSLFSMISTFNADEFNISMLEDPIEYKIPNVTQTQINPDIGFDFSDGLRTLVRQDPDIIMVGEIRDQKTASLAIEASLTGHLVFSTLHTNSASGTIQRLLNMGIDRFLITAAIKLIISQRLIRKICSNCREKYKVPKKFHEMLKTEIDIDPQNAFFYKANGCEKCDNTGYSGRIGLFEVLEMSTSIEELIINNASNSEIESQAVKEGMILLRKDALYKAITGDITIEEALRAIA